MRTRLDPAIRIETCNFFYAAVAQCCPKFCKSAVVKIRENFLMKNFNTSADFCNNGLYQGILDSD